MPPAPRFVPIAPTPGEPVAVSRSPFWIGSASAGNLRINLPTIAERHASVTEREDGYYLSPFSSGTPVRLDGRTITGPTKLVDGVVLDLAPAARFEFVTGAPRVAPVAEEPEPVYEELGPSRHRRRWWRRRRRGARVGFPLWGWLVLALIVAGLGYGGSVLVRTIRSASEQSTAPPPLTEVEGQLYDRLMVEATERIERGATLLDLGLTEEADRELAAAVASFETSLIADNPWVRPSIDALARTVGDIYRSNKLNVPAGLRVVRGKIADLSKSLTANLEPDRFLKAVDRVQTVFQSTFQQKFEITGRDHPEHLSLYGKESAMDVRVKDLRTAQVQFLIDSFGRSGIRVKDFSKDAVLQAQIKAAMARGLANRAGTGLHLHIDRFRDRNDRWTVRR